MKKSKHTNLYLPGLRTYRQQENADAVFCHGCDPFFSTAAIMRPATRAAAEPGLPCKRTNSTSRGWSAGTMSSASPSPGAFLGWTHGAVPVFAKARAPCNSVLTAEPVPLRAESAIPCKTGATDLSPGACSKSRKACAKDNGAALQPNPLSKSSP